MCHNKFMHDLLMTLLAQNFDGFNGLCTKVNDMELHLNKRKKPAKESGKVGNIMVAIVHLKANSINALGAGSLRFRQQSKSDNSPSKEPHNKQGHKTPYSWVQNHEKKIHCQLPEETAVGVFFSKVAVKGLTRI